MHKKKYFWPLLLSHVLVRCAGILPSSKVYLVWHRCHSKPPNCRLARAACCQSRLCTTWHCGLLTASQTPLSIVVCRSVLSVYVDNSWFKSNCIDIKAWLDHHSLLLVSQIKWTLKYLSIRYILQITRHGIITIN